MLAWRRFESGGRFAAAGTTMNPDDPESAQQIVADYVRRLEHDGDSDHWPGSVDLLPYPKQTIKSAIRTSVATLRRSGQLTDELREFLESAYIALADYVAADLAQLMGEYQQASAALASDPRLAREKTAGPAWRTVTESGALAGEIARTAANEAAVLRDEFRELIASC
jgi:hypothetical protein